MRDRARHRPAVISLFLAVSMALVGTTAIGAQPQPVIPVEGPMPSGDGDQNALGQLCPGGSSQAVATRVQLTANHLQPREQATYPGPVVPVSPGTPPDTNCVANLSLSVVIKSPDDRKPDGADASLDEFAVPRSSLESGFDVSLPARSRAITLTDPGKDWEIVKTSCTCSGGSSLATTAFVGFTSGGYQPSQRATYPGPVIPIGSGGGGCTGPSGSSSVTMQGLQLSSSGFHPSQRATYPGPVLPVGPGAPSSGRPAQVSWSSDGTITIDDPDGTGGAFSCSWTVELVNGQFTVKTITKPRGEERRFKYLVTPTGEQAAKSSPVTMRGVPPSNQETLRKGPWSVELTNLPDAWEVKESSCGETDTTTSSVAAGPTATLGIDPGDKVRCSFTLKLLAPRAGKWSGHNGAGRVSCKGYDQKLPAVTDIVRVKVRRDGDLLIVRGLSPGSDTTWRLRRDRDDPRRYFGSVKPPTPGGQGKFETRLKMIDEEHMKGTLTGSVRFRGQRCSFSRPLEATYLGGN
jgi:hypothetical protein